MYINGPSKIKKNSKPILSTSKLLLKIKKKEKLVIDYFIVVKKNSDVYATLKFPQRK